VTDWVVNIRTGKCDVYCGRSSSAQFHYGNPFSHLPNTLASCRVDTREDSIHAFDDWLNGKHPEVEPERRQWILDHLPDLYHKKLGCFCRPQSCHCDILVRRAIEAHHAYPHSE
jgi:hypothetical protein